MLLANRRILQWLVIVTFFVIITILVAAFASFVLKEQQVKGDATRLENMNSDILEGVSTEPIRLTATFQEPIAVGSPLIFGGNHNPLVADQDAWDQMQEIGVTTIRKDLFPEKAIPNTTIENYKSNKNGVSDPERWNQTELQAIKDIFANAKKRNMTTIGILAYTPGWLTYTNTGNGIPKDWDVFGDIAKKIYRIHRDNLDYLEIWNEPSFDYFFKLTGTSLSREEAYKKMFSVAVKAIREVDDEIHDGKRIKIGGPVSHRPFDTSNVEVILKDPELQKELDFISYHNYDAEHLEEPSDIYFRPLMQQYNLNVPIFITEWNFMPNDKNAEAKNSGIDAVLYTGNKFIGFMKMGLGGANYHVLEPMNKNKPNNGEGYYGFYRYENNHAILQSQARTWRLFSKKMGLGKAASSIYELQFDGTSNDDLKSVGFKNSDGQWGMAIINSSDKPEIIQTKASDSNLNGFIKVQVFNASEQNDSTSPVYEGLLKSENGAVQFQYYIPEKSITGLIFTKEKEWYDNLHLPVDKIF